MMNCLAIEVSDLTFVIGTLVAVHVIRRMTSEKKKKKKERNTSCKRRIHPSCIEPRWDNQDVDENAVKYWCEPSDVSPCDVDRCDHWIRMLTEKDVHSRRQREIAQSYGVDWNKGAPQKMGHSQGAGLGLAGYICEGSSDRFCVPVIEFDGEIKCPHPLLVKVHLDGPVFIDREPIDVSRGSHIKPEEILIMRHEIKNFADKDDMCLADVLAWTAATQPWVCKCTVQAPRVPKNCEVWDLNPRPWIKTSF